MPAAAPIIGAIAAVGAGIANNVAQNKARGQARHAFAEQMRQAEIDRQNRINQFNTTLGEQRRIHADNLAIARQTLDANREYQNAQLAQAQQGMQMQAAAFAQQKADADRQYAMQQAQVERGINQQNSGAATFKRPDAGVSGTILTGPLGVEKDKLKKGTTTLLGGV